jgi:hypothetical protein
MEGEFQDFMRVEFGKSSWVMNLVEEKFWARFTGYQQSGLECCSDRASTGYMRGGQ